MKALNNYPPLTPNDILTLRGKPKAKSIKPNNGSSEEKWIYYNISKKNKESFIFKNGRLIGYNMDVALIQE